MDKDNQYKIEQYLNNTFSAKERLVFEKELAQDQTLRQELEFTRDLHQFFEGSNPALEENLSRFGDAYFSDDLPPQNAWWKIAISGLIALLVALGAWWLIADIKQNKSDDLQQEVKKEKESKPLIKEPEIKNTEPEIKSEEKIIEFPKKQKEPKEQQNPSKKQKENNQPIAALSPEDFKLNPILESLIKENVRNGEIKTTLLEPALDLELKYEAQTLLKIKGTTNAIPPLRLIIYTNDPEDFDSNKPYLNTEISTTEKGEEEYEFQFNAKMNFKQGLYYFMIESVETEDLLIVSKFQIK